MNTKKISLFIALIIWSTSFEAMEKETSKKLQMYEIIADEVAKQFTESDKEYQEMYTQYIDIYSRYEKNWDVRKKKFEKQELKREDSWVKQLIGGNFNYTMTLDEIKQIIKDKFMSMKRKGFIISRDQYEKIKDKYHSTEYTNLTRIWGAQYLKKGIKKVGNKIYDTPGYVIVANNPNSINILLGIHDIRFPIAYSLKDNEAFIAFVKITGPSVGDSFHEPPKKLGYVDIGSTREKVENIRRETKTGKYYIVDTEMKSFQHNDKGFGFLKPYKSPISAPHLFTYYAHEKFLHINENVITRLYIPITINLE